jgi:hypothetical protein
MASSLLVWVPQTDLLTSKFQGGYNNFLSDLSSSSATFTDQYENIGGATSGVTGAG